ncbi:MAG: hypothetical protein ACRC6X_03240 [Culicoidibacterales bacterium]
MIPSGQKIRHLLENNKLIEILTTATATRKCDKIISIEIPTDIELSRVGKLFGEDVVKKGGTKMGRKLRQDNEDALNSFETTADIRLKSVNEVGLFLYFGCLNSWLKLKDSSGKTIDEWTRVETR